MTTNNSHIMERIVGDNVRLRRKSETLEGSGKVIKELRDLLRLEESKNKRLTAKIHKLEDKSKAMKDKHKELDRLLAARRKEEGVLLRRVGRLEAEIKEAKTTSKGRLQQLRRISESIKTML